ncbi:NADH(P)-binding [Gaiella occulta]|uniref:NADH(P)-binding n=1 Tax=Gaiella occulta TaxID=1002870 RepID=A0A7M2YZ97_9ACTN|nr:SDR family oxidoreductase [Gaiella occulta]RDI75475.1 NADH(P)-binding [Gaiella occulta]
MGRLILLTGATGYVGGRLLHALERRGERVRCLSRRPEMLRGRVASETEVVAGDVLRPETIPPALDGVDTVYYLVHSMSSSRPFDEADRIAAEAFARAAREVGVRKIVYLGGLGAGDLSAHLASRQEVGRILRSSGVPTIELRASIVIGSGSASFEMIRALVERLPLMVTPRWVRVRAQPIAIEDVLAYLLAALDHEPDGGELYEIGGADALAYVDLMREYARQRGLRRTMIPVPVLTPRLSSLWLWLVTPVYAGVGRKLVDSLRNETVVRDRKALEVFPVRPRGAAEAIARALAFEDASIAETRWSDEAFAQQQSYGGVRHGSRLVDARTRAVPVPPEQAFAPIQRIGGESGWYAGALLWRLRGLLDALVGGPGLRRGRRDPTGVRVGDTIDFWRVEAFEQDRLLRLAAEMRVPGRAWLQFEVSPDGRGGSVVTQTAIFDPAGLFGLVYWYALWPFHGYIFGGMLRQLAAAMRAGHAGGPGRPRS